MKVIDGVLRVPGLRGLILETFGAGNAPSGPDNILTNIIKDAVGRGIVIVNVSQCQSGSVSPLYVSIRMLRMLACLSNTLLPSAAIRTLRKDERSMGTAVFSLVIFICEAGIECSNRMNNY